MTAHQWILAISRWQQCLRAICATTCTVLECTAYRGASQPCIAVPRACVHHLRATARSQSVSRGHCQLCLSIASYQMHNSGRLTDIEPRKPHGYGFFDRGVEIVLKVRVAVAVDERRASHERHIKLLGSVVHPERIVPVVPAKENQTRTRRISAPFSRFGLASAQQVGAQVWTYDRCLSLNTGTERPLDANTPRICSMKYLRGKRCWPFSFHG